MILHYTTRKVVRYEDHSFILSFVIVILNIEIGSFEYLGFVSPTKYE